MKSLITTIRILMLYRLFIQPQKQVFLSLTLRNTMWFYDVLIAIY